MRAQRDTVLKRRIGQVPLEPAIEPDAVVVERHLELADVGGIVGILAHAGTIRARARPANSSRIAPTAELVA